MGTPIIIAALITGEAGGARIVTVPLIAGVAATVMAEIITAAIMAGTATGM